MALYEPRVRNLKKSKTKKPTINLVTLMFWQRRWKQVLSTEGHEWSPRGSVMSQTSHQLPSRSCQARDCVIFGSHCQNVTISHVFQVACDLIFILIFHQSNTTDGGAWLAQWVEPMTLDLRVISLSLALGVEITSKQNLHLKNKKQTTDG